MVKNVNLVQVRRMVHNKNEWRGFVKGYGCGSFQRMNLTMKSYNSKGPSPYCPKM